MKKVKNESQVSNYAGQAENIEQPKKKQKTPLSKKAKIWIACSTALVLVLASVGTLLGVLLSPKLNWHGLSIANYKSYSGIGAASFGNKKTASAVAYASNGSSGNDNMKLAGITQDNTCEEISFVNEKGRKVKQKAYLVLFDAYENYTLLGFSTNKDKEFVELNDTRSLRIGYFDKKIRFYVDDSLDTVPTSLLDKTCYCFILDNNTGKIYDLREVVKAVKNMTKDIFDGFQLYFNYVEEKIFLNVQGNNNGYNSGILVRIDFYEQEIKVIEVLNAMQYKNFTNGSVYELDKYGNVIVEDAYLKLDGTFVDLEKTNNIKYKLGINGVYYKKSGDKTYYLNKNGEFEEIEFDFDILDTLNYYYTFLRKNNIIYAFRSYNLETRLYKIKLDNDYDWKFTIESEVICDVSCSSGVIVGNFVVLFANNDIILYNTETKELTNHTSIYKYMEIKYYRNVNLVRFKAIDTSTRLEVDGYINENGEVEIGDFAGVSFGNTKVYIIKPLN